MAGQPDAPLRWGAATIALHWLAAVLVLVQGLLGLRLAHPDYEPAAKLADMPWHASLGAAIFLLTLVRLLLRLRRRPPHPAHGRLQRLIGRATHALLYGLLLLLPVTGMLTLTSTPGPAPPLLFGLVALPPLHAGDATQQLFKLAHAACASGLFGLATLHVLAVFKHVLWDQDQVFQSMLPQHRSL